ncbi:unnamed protein product [Haemonchus placei]|uniref:AIRS_C domain-containing protein n=1 Tax=Haemonchus placei TaxID=6290 RepID=A0A0N4W693_HAEPC|nr:unnamed protein product [Haemonchus placei]
MWNLYETSPEHSWDSNYQAIIFTSPLPKELQRILLDGDDFQESLMDSIRATQHHSNPNNVIAFCDNSSAIRGFDDVPVLVPADPTTTGPMKVQRLLRHLTYSAETHNFPTAVCPFQGATTGTGGRIRDTHATGRGSYEIAGIAGYSFGNLHLPDYHMPWEETGDKFPYAFSHPRNVIIEASNGASDYGNKFGEPVVCGFARSFGQRLLNGERCEYVKPIMFSGGIGAIDDNQTKKERCHGGMLLAKIGGPVYRVGVGGGAASSQSVQGSRESTLDFCAVQRGDAEMGQKLHRIVRACAELGTSNPILSIHDQGAGGNGNVLKELVEGGGAIISADSFELGDETISARELWTAEYQENDACLVDANGIEKMMAISRREKCTVSVVGTVTDVKRVFHLNSKPISLRQLELPADLTVRQALEMVLRLPSVASKRYLTCKVDRSVTGLVARQQCVGPLHTPLADVAVVALSYFDKVRETLIL